MDLQQCYDMMVAPSINRTRRELDAAKSTADNVKELDADTLSLIRERRSVLKGTLEDVNNINTDLKLDAIPQWLKAKSLENQDKFQGDIEARIRAIDQEVEILITKENTLREAKLTAAKQEYEIKSKPIRELTTLRQGLIDQGFETAWSAAGYAPTSSEYIDVTGYSIDDCYEKLAVAPMPNENSRFSDLSPYEFCTTHVAFSCSILAIFIILALTPIFNIVAIAGIIALIVLIAKQILLQRKITEIFSIISGFNFSAYTHEIGRASCRERV